MHKVGLLFTVVLGKRTSKSLVSGFVDYRDVKTQYVRCSSGVSSGVSCASYSHFLTKRSNAND